VIGNYGLFQFIIANGTNPVSNPGNITATGNMITGNVFANANVNAGNVNVTNTLNAAVASVSGTLTVSGTTTAANVYAYGMNVTNAVHAGSLTVGGATVPASIDSTPTASSTNAVQSGGVYTALNNLPNYVFIMSRANSVFTVAASTVQFFVYDNVVLSNSTITYTAGSNTFQVTVNGYYQVTSQFVSVEVPSSATQLEFWLTSGTTATVTNRLQYLWSKGPSVSGQQTASFTGVAYLTTGTSYGVYLYQNYTSSLTFGYTSGLGKCTIQKIA
jgi:hypothetical protein